MLSNGRFFDWRSAETIIEPRNMISAQWDRFGRLQICEDKTAEYDHDQIVSIARADLPDVITALQWLLDNADALIAEANEQAEQAERQAAEPKPEPAPKPNEPLIDTKAQARRERDRERKRRVRGQQRGQTADKSTDKPLSAADTANRLPKSLTTILEN